MAIKNGGIAGRGLFGHDLDPMKQVAKARARQLVFLIKQITLGDQNQPPTLGEAMQGLLNPGQGLDRMRQHFAPGGQDFARDRTGQITARQLHRRFQHGQGKALYPIAIEAKIARLDRR